MPSVATKTAGVSFTSATATKLRETGGIGRGPAAAAQRHYIELRSDQLSGAVFQTVGSQGASVQQRERHQHTKTWWDVGGSSPFGVAAKT
eukprot:3656827-Pyramimonas_sp.AAC.1